MQLRFTKSKRPLDPAVRRRADTLTCTRDDGSVTASKFRATHDLVHYAVETELDLPGSFFRLIADGMEISAFNQPGAAQKLGLPPGAGHAEAIVGLLEMERLNGQPYSADAFMEQVRTICRNDPPDFDLSDETLERIRARIDELLGAWAAIGPGEFLELAFPCKVAK